MSPSASTPSARPQKPLKPLKGLRILSLALNLPGPAALLRCRALGASCVKIEPPGPDTPGQTKASGDPMAHYNPVVYAALHEGIRVQTANLKTPAGQKALHRALAKTDVLLTSFRPSALPKLGLDWRALHKQYPALSQVCIVGALGTRAEEPGHDLTYQAEHGLLPGLDLPASLFADMGGALQATEAVLQLALLRHTGAPGAYLEVALADAAAYLALPRLWGLTAPGALLGGQHAGYRIYPCKDGRVAVAALEPHFAAALCSVAGLAATSDMQARATHRAITAFLAGKSRKQLEHIAIHNDVPLHTLPK
ncbi:CoA transferase [Variovorax sp. HJSM1_2]|uniref:CoA transferase n=1 Tax=Variovorax sp. HJSM1_2 TaxID=3366263 RepID=UPI003BCFCE89